MTVCRAWSLAKWMAGSNGFARTEKQQEDFPSETAGDQSLVQIAIVYRGNQITIYRAPILARCADEDAVVEEVRITVVHEIAHHFGIDDERLHELGYG